MSISVDSVDDDGAVVLHVPELSTGCAIGCCLNGQVETNGCREYGKQGCSKGCCTGAEHLRDVDVANSARKSCAEGCYSENGRLQITGEKCCAMGSCSKGEQAQAKEPQACTGRAPENKSCSSGEEAQVKERIVLVPEKKSCAKGCCSERNEPHLVDYNDTVPERNSCVKEQVSLCKGSFEFAPERESCSKGCCPGNSDARVEHVTLSVPAMRACTQRCCSTNREPSEIGSLLPVLEIKGCAKSCCSKKQVPPETDSVEIAPKKSPCAKQCCLTKGEQNEANALALVPERKGCAKGCCSKVGTSRSFESIEQASGDCSKGCCSKSNREAAKGKVRKAQDVPQVPQEITPEDMVKSDIKVFGMCCPMKKQIVLQRLLSLPGVESVVWDDSIRTLRVQHDTGIVHCMEIVEAINHKQCGNKLCKICAVRIVNIDGSDSSIVEATILRDGGAEKVSKASDKEQTVVSELYIDGMCCSSEAQALYSCLLPVDGVESVQPNVVLRKVKIVHFPAKVSCTELVDLIDKQGLRATIAKDGGSDSNSAMIKVAPPQDSTRKAPSPKWHVLLGVVLWLISLLQYIGGNWEYIKYAALGSIALCLPLILYRAISRLKLLRLDINMLMSIAVIGAVALGEYSEGAAVASLFSLSDWLQERASFRIRQAVFDLISTSPLRAILATTQPGLGKAGEILPPEKVPIGTRLAVRTGDSVPLDGTVVAGGEALFVNESMLTGESAPVLKGTNSAVSAGSINVGPYLELVTTSLYEDSTLSRMSRLIADAGEQRGDTVQIVERFANVYTPAVFVSALLLATVPFAWGVVVGEHWAKTALVLLVVACPCALVISTPITYICGLAQAARQGILIKGGVYLEALGHMQTLCVDKTGTLTHGTFSVSDLRVFQDALGDCLEVQDVYELVNLAERGSQHPVADALCKHTGKLLGQEHRRTRFQLNCLVTLPGEGVSATVDEIQSSCRCITSAQGEPVLEPLSASRALTLLIGNSRMARRLGWDQQSPEAAATVKAWETEGRNAGWIGLSDRMIGVYSAGDTLREEAAPTMEQLRALGIDVIMLTGDSQGTAAAVAAKIGVAQVYSTLRPEDKCEIVSGMHRVGFVGDGVNDGPALAAADVSVSLGCIGSALALETADVALMSDNLLNLPAAIKLGRLVRRKIIENIVFAFISKIVMVVVTFTVFPSLWLAVLVDVGMMLAVSANSTTILNRDKAR